jgi:sulfur-oxidizing protein SoxY
MPPDLVSRRGFVSASAAATMTLASLGVSRAWGEAPPVLEALHRPRLRLPAATSNGARVPMTVELSHPMEPDHHITMVEVVNVRDPVPVKGVFHFTPANGHAYVAFQARVDEGPSAVTAIAHCGRHGRFTTTAPVTIAEGGGGCVAGPPALLHPGVDEIQGPIIRIPQLVADGEIRGGEIIDVQVKIRHPNRTGLALRDGRFVQDAEPFHLTEMDVVYDGERVSRFVLTAALSDSPMITCKLLARRRADVRVTLTNTRGQRFTATHPVRPV